MNAAPLATLTMIPDLRASMAGRTWWMARIGARLVDAVDRFQEGGARVVDQDLRRAERLLGPFQPANLIVGATQVSVDGLGLAFELRAQLVQQGAPASDERDPVPRGIKGPRDPKPDTTGCSRDEDVHGCALRSFRM